MPPVSEQQRKLMWAAASKKRCGRCIPKGGQRVYEGGPGRETAQACAEAQRQEVNGHQQSLYPLDDRNP